MSRSIYKYKQVTKKRSIDRRKARQTKQMMFYSAIRETRTIDTKKYKPVSINELIAGLPCFIIDFPTEIIYLILLYLKLTEILYLARTCKYFANAILNNDCYKPIIRRLIVQEHGFITPKKNKVALNTQAFLKTLFIQYIKEIKISIQDICLQADDTLIFGGWVRDYYVKGQRWSDIDICCTILFYREICTFLQKEMNDLCSQHKYINMCVEFPCGKYSYNRFHTRLVMRFNNIVFTHVDIISMDPDHVTLDYDINTLYYDVRNGNLGTFLERKHYRYGLNTRILPLIMKNIHEKCAIAIPEEFDGFQKQKRIDKMKSKGYKLLDTDNFWSRYGK